MAGRHSAATRRHVVGETSRLSRGGLLHRVTAMAIAAPKRTLAIAALVMMAAGIFGIPVAQSLSAGGFQDPTAESARATTVLTDKFGQGDVQLLFVVSAPDGVAGAADRRWPQLTRRYRMLTAALLQVSAYAPARSRIVPAAVAMPAVFTGVVNLLAQ
jgi:hypothetical protein